jgi:hypothetical protein
MERGTTMRYVVPGSMKWVSVETLLLCEEQQICATLNRDWATYDWDIMGIGVADEVDTIEAFLV